jgi:hypothetical protein
MHLPKAKFISRQNRGCPLPDMAPVAGVALSLIGCLFLIASFRGPRKGVVALEELPYSTTIMCLRDVAHQVAIGLDNEGHLSFSTSEASLQATVIEQVSKRHKVIFTNSQLAKLKTLPFLATTVEQLPASLSLSAPATIDLTAIQLNYLLTETQLAECAKTAKLAAPSVLGSPVYFSLIINAETGTSKVMKLLALLQAQGVNRFTLQTRY